MALLLQFAENFWRLMLELAPSLLLGLGIAGLLHVFLPRAWIRRGLGKPGFSSVARAALFGVPMPLCSCGVVPTAIGLKNDGASRGAATSFLISTPQTGVDSILVSASFLGWPFALFKVGAAFATGLLGGGIVEWLDRGRSWKQRAQVSLGDEVPGPWWAKLGQALRYSFFDLLAMIDVWLLVGLLASALITLFAPEGSLEDVAWVQGPRGMLLMLALSMPLYVCTTSSVPIAASLIAAGMPLGTALVFLMAGPATNLATLGAVYRGLGGRVLAVFLLTVALMSMAFGLLFEGLLGSLQTPAIGHQHGADPLALVSAVVLSLLLAGLLLRRLMKRMRRWTGARGGEDETEDEMKMQLQVQGMTCMHCVGNVKKALEATNGVQLAEPDLDSGWVSVDGADLDRQALIAAVEKAGYKAR